MTVRDSFTAYRVDLSALVETSGRTIVSALVGFIAGIIFGFGFAVIFALVGAVVGLKWSHVVILKRRTAQVFLPFTEALGERLLARNLRVGSRAIVVSAQGNFAEEVEIVNVSALTISRANPPRAVVRLGDGTELEINLFRHELYPAKPSIDSILASRYVEQVNPVLGGTYLMRTGSKVFAVPTALGAHVIGDVYLPRP